MYIFFSRSLSEKFTNDRYKSFWSQKRRFIATRLRSNRKTIEEKMDEPENDKKHLIEESDRLSSLSDDLIHKILSFNDTKDVIKMSCLSSRWRFIWTTMPCLTFSDEDNTVSEHVLCGRSNQRGVTSVRLILSGNNDSQVFVKRNLDYASSHNVEQLNITCFYERNDVEFPISLFSSQSLKHLTLKADCCYQGRYRLKCDHRAHYRNGFTLTSKWEVPALTTLHLEGITLSHDNFGNFSDRISQCLNLKNLTIKDSNIMEYDLEICHPQLSKLNIDVNLNVFSLVAPQLRSLNIRKFSGAIIVSAPDLAHLNIVCYPSFNLSADDFHSLETVDISIRYLDEQEPQTLFGLLQRLHSVKFLTLNTEILEILSSSLELLSNQHSPFANLKFLKVYPLELTKKANLAVEVINFMLDNSPNATFVMISHEEMFTENNAKKVKSHMADLRMILEKAMARTNSCWGDLCRQIEHGTKKIDSILDKLHTIKNNMRELPASNRCEMQPRFSSLCAEADIVMSRIRNGMKTHFDEYQRRINAHFHELASPLL